MNIIRMVKSKLTFTSGACIVLAIGVSFLLNVLRLAKLDEDLIWAVKCKNLQRAERDLKSGASPNAAYGARDLRYTLAVLKKFHRLPDPRGSPAVTGNPILTAAILNDDVKMTELLLRFGANANMPDYHGTPPLFYAIESQQYRQLIPILIDHHADPNRGSLASLDAQDSVDHAAEFGNIDAIRLLLSQGAGRKLRPGPSHWGGEALLLTSGSDSELACRLTSMGARVNYRDDRGVTPLHNAVLRGDIRLIRLLLWNGADIHTMDADGQSPLSLSKDRRDILEAFRGINESRR